MNTKAFFKRIVLGLLIAVVMASCAIDNDIPYPTVESAITGMTVEGQRGEATTEFEAASINNTARTVTIYVNDSVDITDLKITQLQVSNDALLLVDSAVCTDYEHFPQEGFASLDSIPVSSNTRMDFSKPVSFTLRTYQDYVWTVTVNQIIERTVLVSNQIGDAIVDADSRNVIIYVSSDTDLSNIQIQQLDLGGEYGEVTPAPSTVHDFTSSQTFYARRANEETWEEWTVFVYHSSGEAETSGNVFAMCTSATLTGSIQSGLTPTIEYREQNSSSWTTLSSSAIDVSGTNYTATFTGLTPGTAYQYRVTVNGTAGDAQSFTTVQAVALENGSFENWHEETTATGRSMYVPNAEGSDFWGTGNPGAAAFIGNLTTPTDDAISGQAALLESKNALIKLGAGNIFTGDFELDGTNGILHFGRSFASFPTALRFYYKYTSTTINRIGDEVGDLENLRGLPDSCHVYIALSDKSEPYEIRTRPSVRQVFDKNDANIIAYGEFISGQSTSNYQQITIPLEYRATNRTPRYIIIVCSASKYGDYFIGGEGSTLWLDEMELVYE